MRQTLGPNYCVITDLNTDESFTVFGSEAWRYLTAMYSKRFEMVILSPEELRKRDISFKRCRKLFKKISRVRKILQKEEDNEEILEIKSPIKLICRKKRFGKEIYFRCSDESDKDFEGNACWDLLECKFHKLKKEEAELV